MCGHPFSSEVDEIPDTHEAPFSTPDLAAALKTGNGILLLGVGHVNNTALHLAEYRADYPGKEWVTQGAPVMIDGERQWVTFEDLEGDSDDFEAIGEARVSRRG